MIQKFQQFRIQLLILILTGLAGVGIAVAISTAVTTANATAVTIARIEASGQPANRSGASGAVPEQTDTNSVANDGMDTTGTDQGPTGSSQGVADTTTPMHAKAGQSAFGASDQTTGPDKH